MDALDPMTSMMMMTGQDPFTAGGGASGSQQAMARQLGPLRAMSYINRDSRSGMQMPRQGRNPNVAQFMGGGGMGDGQDYSQYTYDPAAHAAASQFLGQYGLSPLDSSQVKQNTILPNSGFFGNHPRLSGMLEGGLYGAAASRGSNTIGEGITSVADSLIAGPRMRAAAFNQQFERPFQAAHMLEGMQDMSQKRELTEAEIQRTRAQTQALKDKPDPQDNYSVMGRDSAGVLNHRTGQFTPNPGYDPKQASQNHPGIAPIYRYARQLGIDDPDNATPEQWKAINHLAEQEQIHVASARTGADTAARIHAEYSSGAAVPKQVESDAREAAKDWQDPKNKELRSSIRRQAVMAPGGKFPTEDEITSQINEHNRQVNEKVHNVYSSWQQQMNSPMPNGR